MTKNIVLLGVAGVVLLMLLRRGGANTVINLGKPINGVSEIFTGAQRGQAGFGWRYFTDGVSISPKGEYFKDGIKVWG